LCFNPRPSCTGWEAGAGRIIFSTDHGGHPVNHPIARTGLAGAALAVAGLAGCGGDGDKRTTAATASPNQTTATATATATATTGNGTTPGTTTTSQQKEAVVPGKQETLKSGDIGLNVKVLKVVDPVDASVDRAQPGKKLVGVFVEGKTDGTVEPTKTSSLTSLETTDGKVSGIRIIADGDCGGGFSANELLLATEKAVTGCIGFEIPKNATPKSITIVLTSKDGTEQATWDLPKAQ
jgi:hypothetical protein